MAKTPNERPADLEADINAQIARELELAKSRWGETFELKCLEGSRGDMLDDADVLRMLRYFREHGTVYASVLARVEADSIPTQSAEE